MYPASRALRSLLSSSILYTSDRIIRFRRRPTYIFPSLPSTIPVTHLLPRFEKCRVFPALILNAAGHFKLSISVRTKVSRSPRTFGPFEEKKRSSAYRVYTESWSSASLAKRTSSSLHNTLEREGDVGAPMVSLSRLHTSWQKISTSKDVQPGKYPGFLVMQYLISCAVIEGKKSAKSILTKYLLLT